MPLIGIRSPSASPGPSYAFFPHEVSFPVTAFFRFEGSLADLTSARVGNYQYNPSGPLFDQLWVR